MHNEQDIIDARNGNRLINPRKKQKIPADGHPVCFLEQVGLLTDAQKGLMESMARYYPGMKYN